MESFKYFVFNKKQDYETGYLENVRIAGEGIELHMEQVKTYGTFISCLLDSRKQGNKWHRAVIQSKNYGDDSVRFYIYCSDESQVLVDDQIWEWTDLIHSKAFSVEKKHELMQPFLAHEVLNPQDILLYRAKGRYLWLEIQLFQQTEFIPGIQRMKIYAENASFVNYLPEIYQGDGQNDFLRRYLSLFEVVWRDLDAQITNASRQLDPQSAEPEFLNWMASWVGISDVHLWPEERLKLLLNGIVKKNLIRGTRAYMEHMIETFIGEKPYFVEYDEIERYSEDPEVYENLKQNYAHGPYQVNVIIKEDSVRALRKQRALRKIIEDMKPAHMEVHLIVLKPYIYLNQNAYVGVNSLLGTYQKAHLNGITAIPSIVEMTNIGGEGERL